MQSTLDKIYVASFYFSFNVFYVLYALYFNDHPAFNQNQYYAILCLY